MSLDNTLKVKVLFTPNGPKIYPPCDKSKLHEFSKNNVGFVGYMDVYVGEPVDQSKRSEVQDELGR